MGDQPAHPHSTASSQHVVAGRQEPLSLSATVLFTLLKLAQNLVSGKLHQAAPK
jgi:hypothetical protein